MNVQDTAKVMQIMQAAYPHTEITDPMYDLWHNGFATTDTADVIAAVGAWIETEQFFPTIAGIRSKMRDRAAEQRRELAWTARPDPTDPPIPLEEGRRIAAAAYEAECVRDGREPNWAHWRQSMGIDPTA